MKNAGRIIVLLFVCFTFVVNAWASEASLHKDARDAIGRSLELIEAGEHQAAVDNIKALIESSDDQEMLKMPRLFLSDVYLGLGLVDEAIAVLRDYLKHFPDDARIHLHVASIAPMPLAEIPKFLWHLEQAYNLGVETADVYFRKGTLLKNIYENELKPLEKSKYYGMDSKQLLQRAIFCLEICLILAPDFHPARGNLADIFFNIGNFKRARVKYKKLLDVDSHQSRTVIPRYAHACIQDGDSLVAVELLLPLKKKLNDEDIEVEVASIREKAFLAMEIEFRASLYIYLSKAYFEMDKNDLAINELSELLSFIDQFDDDISLSQRTMEWVQYAQNMLKIE